MIPKLDFTLYLLNEAQTHFAQKSGDILTALQNLHDDGENLGTRQLVKAAQGIVNQIRRILHDTWPDTEKDALEVLQKIAVALSKAIDENTDLKDIIASSIEELQQATGEAGEPINDLGSEGGESQDDEQS